jgi:hypothetical protein
MCGQQQQTQMLFFVLLLYLRCESPSGRLRSHGKVKQTPDLPSLECFLRQPSYRGCALTTGFKAQLKHCRLASTRQTSSDQSQR